MGLAVVRAPAQDSSPVGDKLEVLVLQPEGAVVPGQAFALGVRILIDAEFLDEQVVQLFRQELDLPLQINAHWLESFPGLQLEPLDEIKGDISLVLNQTVTQAREGPPAQLGERRLRTFDLVRLTQAKSPGRFPLAAPSLRVAFATSFRDELLAARVPLDRTDSTIHGTASELVVRPFPEQGRPLAFVDAVGRFSLQASISDGELEAGQALSLTIRIEGSGNLAEMTPPRVDTIQGWRLQGTGVAREAQALVLVATLIPDNPRVRELPGVEFAWYDPGLGEQAGGPYQLAQTPVFPIRVREPRNPAIGDAPSSTPGPAQGSGTDSGRKFLFGSLLGALVAAAAWFILRRKKAGVPDRIDRAPLLQAAVARFESSPGDDSKARERALREFLARAFDCTQDQVLHHDFSTRMLNQGLSADLSEHVRRSLAEFDAAHFGGGPPPREDLPALVRKVAQELTADLARRA